MAKFSICCECKGEFETGKVTYWKRLEEKTKEGKTKYGDLCEECFEELADKCKHGMEEIGMREFGCKICGIFYCDGLAYYE